MKENIYIKGITEQLQNIKMRKIKKTEYKTTIREVKKALELADKDKKIIIEHKRKVTIICEFTKEQTKELNRHFVN